MSFISKIHPMSFSVEGKAEERIWFWWIFYFNEVHNYYIIYGTTKVSSHHNPEKVLHASKSQSLTDWKKSLTEESKTKEKVSQRQNAWGYQPTQLAFRNEFLQFVKSQAKNFCFKRVLDSVSVDTGTNILRSSWSRINSFALHTAIQAIEWLHLFRWEA